MKNKVTEFLAGFLGVIFAAGLIAAAPTAIQDWERYARLGAPNEGHSVVVTTTFTPITTGAGVVYDDEATVELFQWESIVVTWFSVNTCICMVMDDDVTATSGDDIFCGDINDPNTVVPNTTHGPCWISPAGIFREKRIGRDVLKHRAMSSASMAGFRHDACASPPSLLGYGCDDVDDCPGGTGSACSSSVVPTGAFLMIKAAESGAGMIEQEI